MEKELRNEFLETLRLKGINSKGFGIIPKAVMLDTDLTIESKGIYAYLSSYTDSNNTAYPSRDKILHDLKMSKDAYYRHLKPLIEEGYIKVTQKYNGGKLGRNTYTIVLCPEKYLHSTDENAKKIAESGINALGFGCIPKAVMIDDRLSIKSKALYAYYCSFKGSDAYAEPKVKNILYHLGIVESSLCKYKRKLVELNYITVKQLHSNGRLGASRVLINENPDESLYDSSRSVFVVCSNQDSETQKIKNQESSNQESEKKQSENQQIENQVSEKQDTVVFSASISSASVSTLSESETSSKCSKDLSVKSLAKKEMPNEAFGKQCVEKNDRVVNKKDKVYELKSSSLETAEKHHTEKRDTVVAQIVAHTEKIREETAEKKSAENKSNEKKYVVSLDSKNNNSKSNNNKKNKRENSHENNSNNSIIFHHSSIMGEIDIIQSDYEKLNNTYENVNDLLDKAVCCYAQRNSKPKSLFHFICEIAIDSHWKKKNTSYTQNNSTEFKKLQEEKVIKRWEKQKEAETKKMVEAFAKEHGIDDYTVAHAKYFESVKNRWHQCK